MVHTVAVAMGDSFLSGQGAGDYVRRPGFAWWGSIEDENYCDRSIHASIHVAELWNIDRTYNIACSGATLSDLVAPSGARAGVESQIDQLVEIASLATQQVELIQLAIGVNNDAFFFGKIVEACVSGFLLDGFTHNGAALSFTIGKWYGWAFDGLIGGGDTEGLHRQCNHWMMPFYRDATQTASVNDLRDAIEDFLNVGGDPTGGAVSSYLADLDAAWFAGHNDDIPMMSLPFPADVNAALTGWEDSYAPFSTQSGDPESLRLLRLLHSWAWMTGRQTWGSDVWNADISDVRDELVADGSQLQFPPSQYFPPSFRGEALSWSEFRSRMMIANDRLPQALVFNQWASIADAIVELTDRLEAITENGESRYPPGSYRIVIQDYASPFDPELTIAQGDDGSNRFKPLVRSRYAAGCPVHQATAAWVGDVSVWFSEMFDQVAHQVDLDRPGHDIVRLDVLGALDGGRLCESHSTSLVAPVRFANWESPGWVDVVDEINATTTAALSSFFTDIASNCEYWEYQVCQESAHPNAAGHEALGHCLAAAWLATTDRIDCDRVNGEMLANDSVITFTPPEPYIAWDVVDSSSELIVTQTAQGPVCDYIEWEMQVQAEVVDIQQSGTWDAPVWGVSFGSTSDQAALDVGMVSVTGSTATLGGVADCVSGLEVAVELFVNAGVSGQVLDANGPATMNVLIFRD